VFDRLLLGFSCCRRSFAMPTASGGVENFRSVIYDYFSLFRFGSKNARIRKGSSRLSIFSIYVFLCRFDRQFKLVFVFHHITVVVVVVYDTIFFFCSPNHHNGLSIL
jgi:hypothetical protein